MIEVVAVVFGLLFVVGLTLVVGWLHDRVRRLERRSQIANTSPPASPLVDALLAIRAEEACWGKATPSGIADEALARVGVWIPLQ